MLIDICQFTTLQNRQGNHAKCLKVVKKEEISWSQRCMLNKAEFMENSRYQHKVFYHTNVALENIVREILYNTNSSNITASNGNLLFDLISIYVWMYQTIWPRQRIRENRMLPS